MSTTKPASWVEADADFGQGGQRRGGQHAGGATANHIVGGERHGFFQAGRWRFQNARHPLPAHFRQEWIHRVVQGSRGGGDEMMGEG